ncbi:URC4/urg3 family protein [Uliginosibacterium sp. H1]|uniref:URC4/urg3 family protein n=1 Tax=Uliginosibacterium sp. H1 TaxID=3114757 RepID=UPI002E17E11E|nr:URC4/urg3 family protein [Uliginosibacterium sp. H1]
MKAGISDGSGEGWHTPVSRTHPAAMLLSASAVRMRCEAVMGWVEQGGSPHFTWHPDRMEAASLYVANTIHERYPDLDVPYHSRWRHFESGEVDRWAQLVDKHGLAGDVAERARVAIDLVIPSVLLDAGAGAAWRFFDAPTGQTLKRSEGLGVASLRMFEAGAFSADAKHPLRSDATGLQAIGPAHITKAFQAGGGSPLVGIQGRAALLRSLGHVIARTPAVFGSPARLGNLYDYLLAHARDGRVNAAFILGTLLRALGPVWPGRMTLEGVPLGDCWEHPALADGYVPFHKLTQWLTYSLLEPLEEAGLRVEGLDALTGLPEYRNGGLLIDIGLLEPRDPAFFGTAWEVSAEPIVEWRAVTVVALDRIAAAVRQRLKLSEAQFPLARVLEGGTWAAGRRIAAEKRPGGGPPLTLVSDGTVF